MRPRAFCRLEIDDQSKGGRLLHGKIARLRAFEDLVHIWTNVAPPVRSERIIGQESPSFDHLSAWVHGGQPTLCGEIDDPLPVVPHEGVRQHDERLRPRLGHRGKGAVQLLRLPQSIVQKRHVKRPCRCPNVRPEDIFGRIGHISEDGHAGDLRDSFLEELQIFPCYLLTDVVRKPRDVAAWSREAGTNPFPTGSTIPIMTMGIVLVASLAARTFMVVKAIKRSTLSLTRSIAEAVARSDRPPVHRHSMMRFWPWTYPRCRKSSTNACQLRPPFVGQPCWSMSAGNELTFPRNPIR